MAKRRHKGHRPIAGASREGAATSNFPATTAAKVAGNAAAASARREPLPTVSLCTVTRNRAWVLPLLEQCILAQSYPRERLEWVIVDDSDPGQPPFTPSASSGLKVRHEILPQRLILGEKRNLSHGLCGGEIIVYMDDDDYYPPSRVRHAVESLQRSGRLVAGSTWLPILFLPERQLWIAGPYGDNHATANTFAFRRELLRTTRYEDTASSGEEKFFLRNYTIPMVQMDPRQTIVCFAHGSNTFEKRKLIAGGRNPRMKRIALDGDPPWIPAEVLAAYAHAIGSAAPASTPQAVGGITRQAAKRPRLLFVSPCLPNAEGTGWERRAHSLLRSYARHFEIELWFQPTFDRTDISPAVALVPFCCSIHPFYSSLITAARNRVGAELHAAIKQAQLVHVFRLPEIARIIRHRNLIWDLDEIPEPFRELPANLEAEASPEESALPLLEGLLSVTTRARMVQVSSGLEIRSWLKAAMVVIPNTLPASSPAEVPAVQPGCEANLLFVGNMNHPPNIEALRFFLSEVFAAILARRPDAKLRIAGRRPIAAEVAGFLAEAAGHLPIQLDFDPLRMEAAYAASGVSISPILSGGGTRLKILESFQLARPVVSTRKGAEGIEAHHGIHLLIADEPAAFAEGCLALIGDGELRSRLVANALQLVRECHSPAALDRSLDASLAQAGLIGA